MAMTKLTYADLVALPEDGNRYELIGGVLYMSPAPSPRHQSVATKVGVWLTRAEDAGHGRAYLAPIDLVLDPEEDAVQPDALFVHREHLHIIRDAVIAGVPDLIVEILSPTSRRRDLVLKRQLYARHGVPDYRVVNLEHRSVITYHLTTPGVYEEAAVLRDGDLLASPLFPGITIPVRDLFR